MSDQNSFFHKRKVAFLARVQKFTFIYWSPKELCVVFVDNPYMFVNGLDFAGGQVQQITMNCRVQSLSSVRSAWLKLVL